MRNVRDDDLDVYYRIYCDPVMMAHLGGARPREEIPGKLRRHVAATAGDEWWCSMIVPDDTDPDTIAGMVTIDGDRGKAEIGWAVLPEFQGRGVASAAVRLMVLRAAIDGRWGVLNAYPGVDNPASNGICRTLGFRLVGQAEATFSGLTFHSNHWQIDPPGERLAGQGTRATAT